MPNPVIVVPGITATYLRDEYPLPPEMVWTVMTNTFERSTLHPDNLKYESAEPARVVADQIYQVAYRELISELRHNLATKEDLPVPVYPFGYDWRQPLVMAQARLAAFIDEVIERTKLLRHYASDDWNDEPKVNLIGHSMGGLLIAGCLKGLGGKARVGKVATLASPFRGSLEAVVKVTTGTASIGGDEPSSRERESARITPALYHLLPKFDGAVDVNEPTFPKSLFEFGLWQPGIVATIAEYIRLHGLDPAKRDVQAQDLLQSMLDEAKTHRNGIEGLDLATVNLEAADWLCVVGADCTTRVRMQVLSKNGKPEFNLRSADRMNLWSKGKTPEERRLTGDGTVPMNGAVPGFLGLENLVCVTPEDFGYWEIGDKILSSQAGFHGILPNMDMVHRMIVRHFTGRGDKHGNTWGQPMPGVTEKDWVPAVELKLP
jgi:pimeloyl-ACP methyl ester carboxylesterase